VSDQQIPLTLGGDDPDDTLREILKFLYGAMAKRSEVSITLRPKPGKRINAKMLAHMERSISRLVRDLMLSAGCKVPKAWKLELDVAKMTQVDDGNNDLIIKLDFAKVFRSPEGIAP
jgi:hypothetical protein